jgi:hypothetical protein
MRVICPGPALRDRYVGILDNIMAVLLLVGSVGCCAAKVPVVGSVGSVGSPAWWILGVSGQYSNGITAA